MNTDYIRKACVYGEYDIFNEIKDVNERKEYQTN